MTNRTNSKFNLKIKKIFLTLLAIAILATTVSNVSAAITVEFDPATPKQITLGNSIPTFNVYVRDSGQPVANAQVDIYFDNAIIGTYPTSASGKATFHHYIFLTSSGNHNYRAVSGSASTTHTIRFIDPNPSIPINPNNPTPNNPNNQNPSNPNNNQNSNNPNNQNQGNSDKLSLNKGVIYKGNNVVGIWDGKYAYTLNSAGQLVKSSTYTSQVKQAIAKGQITSSKVGTTTTSKLVKFVNNIASNKITNSAVYALSKIYSKVNKGTIASKLLAAEITANNLGAKKFSGNNIYISANAIKSVLNKDVSKKYIARKNIKVNALKTVFAKGKSILVVKNIKSKKWHYIAVSKVANKKFTVYDNKNSKKVTIKSLTSFMKNKYKFSGVGITYNVKIGKTPNTAYLKALTGI